MSYPISCLTILDELINLAHSRSLYMNEDAYHFTWQADYDDEMLTIPTTFSGRFKY